MPEHMQLLLSEGWDMHGMVWYGMVEVCDGAPVAVGGWDLTGMHDLVPCAANHLHRVNNQHFLFCLCKIKHNQKNKRKRQGARFNVKYFAQFSFPILDSYLRLCRRPWTL